VLKKDAVSNSVTLGRNEELFKEEITLSGTNISSAVSIGEKYDVKIRYAHKAAAATVTEIGDNSAKIVFDEPQRAPAAGQSAVIYNGEILVGGGFIK